ncbi:class I SAM-dependent methyltransferase [Candidatus Moduliflexota bacterium]
MTGQHEGLRKPLPRNRTFEQLRHHYEVERAIARRLKKANREERKALYATMYNELFRQVPDHPRLTQRQSDEMSATAIRSKMNFVRPFINSKTVFVEFAPGDCLFAAEVSGEVERVYGVDISDQRGKAGESPENFELIVYDGYCLDLEENSVDVFFSDQLIEHLHPDDTAHHFRTVKRILKKGGLYLFRTPHSYLGPEDISGYFSEKSEGFHLKEWTYRELAEMVDAQGYESLRTFYPVKGRYLGLTPKYFSTVENAVKYFPSQMRRLISTCMIRGIHAAAVK